MSKLPSQSELLRVFKYDPKDGLLTWRTDPGGGGKKIGDRAGNDNRVTYRGRAYIPTSIIWKILHDEEPEMVDHRDRDHSNNRETNLRAATRTQNNQNKSVRIDSGTGVRGVRFHRGRYWAGITANGDRVDLGTFDTLEEAAEIRQQAERQYHGEFS